MIESILGIVLGVFVGVTMFCLIGMVVTIFRFNTMCNKSDELTSKQSGWNHGIKYTNKY